jgi:hypothetical protein
LLFDRGVLGAQGREIGTQLGVFGSSSVTRAAAAKRI